jgi:hypothetical protein
MDKPAFARPPELIPAFTAHVEIGPPVDLGMIEGGRRRFIPILGGRVEGPRLTAAILPAGGDWQTILPQGITRVEARYFLEAEDGTAIELHNPGLRVASEDVTERITRGEPVDAGEYYFRTTPRFTVAPGRHEWLAATVFVARGTRLPDKVVVEFFAVG